MNRAAIVFLTLTLALGSVYQAVLNLAHGTGTMVELCIGGQPVTVAIGPSGEPSLGPATPHDCIDCALIAGFDRPALAGLSPHRPVLRDLTHPSQRLNAQQGPILAAALARAPPAFV